MGGDFNFPRSDRPPGSNEPLRARGARYWTVKGYLEYAKNDPEYIERTLRKRISQSNARAARELKASLEVKTPSGKTVKFPEPRLQSQGEKRSRNRDYTQSGDPPRTRMHPKGKGRSTSIPRVTTPSLELQEGADAKYRIGAIAGAKGGKQSGSAILSNFGANKDFGDGWAGKSAGRVRGMVNLLKHPETFAGRFLWVYVAQQVTQAVTNWRSWDKVSWTMGDRRAEQILRDENRGQEVNKILRGVAPILGGALGLVGTVGQFGLATWGARFGFFGAEAVEARLAKASRFIDDHVAWFRSGANGMSPHRAAGFMNDNMGALLDSRQSSIEYSIDRRLRESLEKNARIAQDDLRVLAVGGVDALVSAAPSTPEYKEKLDSLVREARIKDAQADQIMNEIMGRLTGMNK